MVQENKMVQPKKDILNDVSQPRKYYTLPARDPKQINKFMIESVFLRVCFRSLLNSIVHGV